VAPLFSQRYTFFLCLLLFLGIPLSAQKVTPELQGRIQKAIRQGTHFLFQKISKEKYTHGQSALFLLALFKAGEYPLEDEVLLQAFSFLLTLEVPEFFSYDTYTPGLFLMVGQEFSEQAQKISPERHSPHLQELLKKNEAKMKQVLQSLIQTLNAHLKRNNIAGWGIPDLSNTQYGILGLHAAAEANFFNASTHPHFDKIWKNILRGLLHNQNIPTKSQKEVLLKNIFPPLPNATKTVSLLSTKKNKKKAPPGFLYQIPQGWGYQMRSFSQARGLSFSYGSMTCTGIASVTLALHYLKQEKKLSSVLQHQAQQSILGGLAWIQKFYSVTDHPEYSKEYYYYYLYALERVGVLCKLDLIDDHDWYVEGASVLCELQGAEGSWKGETESDEISTAFALLFLKRATNPLPVTTPSSGTTASSEGEEK
jgi:hypothetical protein